jgi:hypothetical protein
MLFISKHDKEKAKVMEDYEGTFTPEVRLIIWSKKTNIFHVNNRTLFLTIWAANFSINEVYTLPTE